VSEQLQLALVGGLFGVVGTIIGGVLSYFATYFQHKREKEDRLLEGQDAERAVFSGAFAVCGYIAEKLNHWDAHKDVDAFSRLQVVQPYLTTLINRSPPDSERLMVALFDVGIRLEAVLFATGFALGLKPDPDHRDISEIDDAARELSSAVERIEIILGSVLPILDIDEIDEIVGGRPMRSISREEQPE
jgi:hypothetical protein